jgi:hypothetical protein
LVSSPNVDDIELDLQAYLRPVRPNPEFVRRLKLRLKSPPTVVLEKSTSAVGLILIAAGLLTGVLVVIFGRRIARLF